MFLPLPRGAGGTGPELDAGRAALDWERAAPALCLGVFSLFPLACALLRWPYLNDDSYITLTFSKSLAEGRGFVFNHGPPTLGSTTPLLVLIGAVLQLVLPWLPLALGVTLFTSGCLVASAWTFYYFREAFRLNAWQACLAGLTLYATCNPWLFGMEAYVSNGFSRSRPRWS